MGKDPKLCIECNDKPAYHWNRSFCEVCFRKLLSEKLENEDQNGGLTK
jgi:hypothetical protein